MKHFVKTTFTAVATLCCLSASSLGVYAATVDECAAVARSYGVSESAIQSAYNAYYAEPEKYTPEILDQVIQTLHLYGTDSDAAIKAYFGITDEPSSSGSSDSSSQESSESSSSASTTETSESTSNTGNTGGTSSGSTSSSESSGSSGGYNSPIESSDFINMSIDEKVEFVNSLPEEERAGFIENLSNEERNSIIKQLPIDDKTELLSKFAEAGSAMGLNMTVDEITDDSVSLSIRNQDGTLVDQSSLGIIVEDTGYDYRILAGAISAGIILSSAGIYLISRKISREEENNER